MSNQNDLLSFINKFLVLFLFIKMYQNCDFASNYYLDPMDNICKPCAPNTVSKKHYCVCDEFSYANYYIPSQKDGCTKCPNNYVADQYSKQCIVCQEANCVCTFPNSYRQIYNIDGSAVAISSCVQCLSKFKADKELRQCVQGVKGVDYSVVNSIACLSGYTLYQGNCILTTNLSLLQSQFQMAKLMSLDLSKSSYSNIQSSYIQNNAYYQASLCISELVKEFYCAAVFSMCVTQQSIGNAICQLYQYLYNLNADPTRMFPYQAQIQPIGIINSSDIVMQMNQVNLDQEIIKSQLNLKTIIPCMNWDLDFNIGKNDTIKCRMSLSILLNIQGSIFSLDFANGKDIYKVPIYIASQIDDLNQPLDFYQKQTLVAAFGFFQQKIYENSSKNFAFVITKAQLKIFIKDKKYYTILVLYSQMMDLTTVALGIDFVYKQETIDYDNVLPVAQMYIFLGSLLLAGLLAVAQTIIYCRNTKMVSNEENYYFLVLGNFIAFLIQTVLVTLLLVQVIFQSVIYFLYKLNSSNLFTVPQQDSSNQLYYLHSLILLICFILSLCIFLIQFLQAYQTRTLFIDWEEQLFQKENSAQQKDQGYKSAWRGILVANEFYELLTENRLLLEIILLGFMAATNTFDLNNKVSLYINENQNSFNSLFKFALWAIVFIALYILYDFIVSLYELKTGSKIQNFLDLISLANISVLFLDHRVHGFYLHGQNRSGSSEQGLENLKKGLQKEAKGVLLKRGLMGDSDSELQSFELFLPINFNDFLNNEYFLELKSQINKRLNNEPIYQARRFYNRNSNEQNDSQNESRDLIESQHIRQRQFQNTSGTVSGMLPLDLDFDYLFERQEEVCNILKEFILQIQSWKEKLYQPDFYHSLFGYCSLDLYYIQDLPIVFNDESYTIEKQFVLGQEKLSYLCFLAQYLFLNQFISNDYLLIGLIYLIYIIKHYIHCYLLWLSFVQSSMVSERLLG